MTQWVIVAAVAGALALALAVPRILVRRAQDRLARRLLAEDGGRFKLLTRAELSRGTYRRLPGVLGLTAEALVFEGLFGETEALSTARIQKIVTGDRLAGGRRLLRAEILRIAGPGGGQLEFVLTPDSAAAWRSHLGLWAVQERKSAIDTVSPGRG